MSQSFNTIAAGVLSASTVKTETDKMSSYLRGGVASGDVDAASLSREHVFKMEHYDYPLGMGRSELQMLIGTQTPPDQQDWREKRHREVIFVDHLSSRDDWPVPRLAKTFYLPARAYVICTFWMSAFEFHNSQTNHSGSEYGSTPAATDLAGSFVAKVRDHSDNSFTTDSSSRVQVCNNQSTFANYITTDYRKITAMAQFQLTAAGTYTIFVAYERDYLDADADDVAREVIVGNRGMVLEPVWY